ncbi:MAG TPA: ABC transporter permease [Streptosporangiaceae bacterium]|nr:ABC transporter permease [Streptosporangiaceae bacterium]
MTRATYLRYEVLRSFRNWRFLILTLAFPLVLYFAVASQNRHATFHGIAFPVYFMAAMATLGTMASVISGGAVIAADRAAGWTRQIRTTPLKVSTYLRTKVFCGYLRALLAIVLLALAGAALGVRLSAGEWVTVVFLLLVGLVPFAVLGIMIGHLISTDAMGPAVGGIVTLFSLLGGVYGFQIASSGPMFELIKALPSYWLVQAGKTAIGGGGWPAEGWIVIAVWTAVLLPLTVLAYRRDTSRA